MSDRTPPLSYLTLERALIVIGTVANELVMCLLSVPAHMAPVVSTYTPSCSSEQPARHSRSPQRGEGRAIWCVPGIPLSPFSLRHVNCFDNSDNITVFMGTNVTAHDSAE